MVKFKPDFERRYPRITLIVAIVALINLGLVFFDLTYINLRQVYRQSVPAIVQLYDPVKGIEVNPETEDYQAQVDRLKGQLAENELQSPPIEATLSELRTLSDRLMTERAFVAPNGDFALATVQQKIRARTGQRAAHDAFEQFWSSAYLAQQGWQSELQFWETQINPFFQANYYRHTNQFGLPVDYFWLIDLPFMLIFAVEVITRIVWMHRRNPDVTWLDVVLRRWYDGFLLLPFLRWLRIIPVALRLYQVDLLDLEPMRAQVQRDTIVTVGADLAGIVGIQLIDQMQETLRQGNLINILAAVEDAADGNASTNGDAPQEVFALTDQLYDVSVQHILPRIQPDIEDLMQHSLTRTLEQMLGYPQLHHLPGLGKVSTQVVQQVSSSVVQGIYHSMADTLSDAEGKEITDRLQRNLREAIAEEFDQHNTLQEVQSRLLNVLEEFKSKYVKALAEVGGEKLAERTEELHRQIR